MSTYAYNPVTDKFLYFFTNTANNGATSQQLVDCRIAGTGCELSRPAPLPRRGIRHNRLNRGRNSRYNPPLCANAVPNTKERAMARVCQVTGKAPMVGNNVSHANNKTKRRFLPNLQQRRFWVESENRWVSLRLTNAALRTIDKNGIDVGAGNAARPRRARLTAAVAPPTEGLPSCAKRSSSNRRPARATSTRR